MRKIVLLPILIVFLFISCKSVSDDTPESTDIFDKLQALQGVEVDENPALPGFTRSFQITVTQPVDHNNPSGPTFKQTLHLSHKDESLPMVMLTAGYTARQRSISELADLLNSNHISMTHRYFAGSEPDPMDWQYLTIWQAASDHHRIVELFKTIYNQKWVNTGVSKSGMCAMFHRRFYPDDVDVTVAFAAPILTGLPDSRFNSFLENELGDEACRLKIKAFQRRVLENRAGMLPLLADYQAQNGLSFSIGLDAVLEHSVLEYWFSFFQYGTADCTSIPGDGESLQTMFNHLNQKSSPKYYSDRQIDHFKPFFYQAYTQLGYYSFITHHVRDLLVAVPWGDHRLLAPTDVTMNYDPQPMQDILNWLRNHGNNIIYIYGGHDPYTVAAVELTGTTNALKIIQPDADHGIKIQDLNEKQLVYDTLEEWLGVTINRDASLRSHRENQIYHHL